jgi:flagellin
MIQSTGSVASLLSQVYSASTESLNSSLHRISSGKRVNGPSDDFTSYSKSITQSNIKTQYEAFNRDLQSAKAKLDYMLGVGNSVVETLGKMKELAGSYASADATGKASLNAKYIAMNTSLVALIGNAMFEGTASVYTTGAQAGVAATVGSSSFAMNVTAAQIATLGSLSTSLSATTTELDAQIMNGQNYIAAVQSGQSAYAAQIKVNSTAISSFGAAISAMIDVNEAEEMGNVTAQQVRQQAAASMMAQANSSLAAIARIFG